MTIEKNYTDLYLLSFTHHRYFSVVAWANKLGSEYH